VIEAISRLRESALAPASSIIPDESGANLPELNAVIVDLGHSIRALKKRNRLFQDILTPDELEVKGRTWEKR